MIHEPNRLWKQMRIKWTSTTKIPRDQKGHLLN